MASDQAIQQHIFLSALEKGPLSELDIYERMETISLSLCGTDYYQQNPDPLPGLIKTAELDGFIVRRGYDWEITESGRRWRDYSYNAFIRPTEPASAA